MGAEEPDRDEQSPGGSRLGLGEAERPDKSGRAPVGAEGPGESGRARTRRRRAPRTRGASGERRPGMTVAPLPQNTAGAPRATCVPVRGYFASALSSLLSSASASSAWPGSSPLISV
ncbi:hypothetical protein GCM10017559_34790 [Streptosporangium longisporum]|uniref:Uncharacterized protein n=1 Tax=Streptosporangium longisporum TaxID=46187 RepID=A0ABP6KGB5_9ACTN